MENKQNNRPDDSEKDFNQNSRSENNKLNDNDGHPPRQGSRARAKAFRQARAMRKHAFS